MARRRADGLLAHSRHLGRFDEPHPPAPVRGARPRPARCQFADHPRPVAAGANRDAARHRRRPDAHVRPVHPPVRRPHRDALSRVRLPGIPGVLPRLAGFDHGLRRGRPGSLPARLLLAGIGVRHGRRLGMAHGSNTPAGSPSRTSSSLTLAGKGRAKFIGPRSGKRPSKKPTSASRNASARGHPNCGKARSNSPRHAAPPKPPARPRASSSPT